MAERRIATPDILKSETNKGTTMTATQNASARGQRRGFYWQDWYAAWVMLRALVSPTEGIIAVEVESADADAKYIDDVIVHREATIVYRQLKHKIPGKRLVSSDLFAKSNDDTMTLLAKLFRGWTRVRGASSLPVEIRLTTNAPGSDHSSNLLISPVEFEQRILASARLPSWIPDAKEQEVLSELRALAGAPDVPTLKAFLADLYLDYGEPDETAIKQEVMRSLGTYMRSRPLLELEAVAWAERVYDLSTRHGETAPFSRIHIERELRLLVGHHHRVEHRLALPAHHLKREEISKEILKHARALKEGYMLVVGPPGCGKTTLATWIANEHDDEILMRYHAFDPRQASKLERESRASAYEFVSTMFDVLADRFPDQVTPRALSEERLAEAVRILRDQLASLATQKTRLVLVDGIDHVVRTGLDRKTLFDALPQPAPDGVVFVLFGQPDWDYPRWLKHLEPLRIDPLSRHESRTLVCQSRGWSPSDVHTGVVCDAVYEKTAGNPLSLFYSLRVLEALGHTAEDVAGQLKNTRLFGASPHLEYARLLDDLEARVPAPQGSRPLREEMLACVAIATTEVTDARLVAAFAEDDLTKRQAQDFLIGLRPVIVERRQGCFWIFHDDFRRYAEERTSPQDRSKAHCRFAAALEQDWHGEEIRALAEHHWQGGNHAVLADLPESRPLEEWFAAAPPRAVVTLYRLALAAALQLVDDLRIMRNALALARAQEAADLPWHASGPAVELGIMPWTMSIPPSGNGFHVVERRALALRVAAKHYDAEPELAKEIAGRFELPIDSLDTENGATRHALEEYLEALTEWKLYSSDLSAIATLLGQDDFRGAVVSGISKALSEVRNSALARQWVGTLGGLDPHIAQESIGVATAHIVRGRDFIARQILEALLQSEKISEIVRRDAMVLLSLLDGQIRKDYSYACERLEWSGRDFNPIHFRTFFFRAFARTAVGSILDLDAALLPSTPLDRQLAPATPAEVETASQTQPAPSQSRQSPSEPADPARRRRSHEDPSHSPPRTENRWMPAQETTARFLWKVGSACGLAMRNDALLLEQEFQELLDQLMPVRSALSNDLDEHARLRSAAFLLPMVARAVQRSESLSDLMAQRLTIYVRLPLQIPDVSRYGCFEALWCLRPELWRELALDAYRTTRFPKTESYERTEWCEYWLAHGEARGVAVPTAFIGLSRVARLGVPRKTDPAALAVELVCKQPNHPDIGPRIEHLITLLIRLDSEPGGSASLRHLPTVLALALDANPRLFASEFVRCTAHNGIAEAFGTLPSEIAAIWLKASRQRTDDELIALWYWVAAAPGSMDNRDELGDIKPDIANRLSALGLNKEADHVRDWVPLPRPKASSAGSATASRSGNAQAAGPLPTIVDIRPSWFSAWWSGDKNRALRKHVETGGEDAWQDVCRRLANQASGSEEISAYEYLILGERIRDFRSGIPLDAAVEIAMSHLAEMVRFQESPEPVAIEGSLNRGIPEILIGLIARGIEVSDVETVQYSLRSLAALAIHPGTRGMVIREMRWRLQLEDVSLVHMALLLLRRAGSLPLDVLDEIRTHHEGHSDAWCRYLACQILGTEPRWPSPREVGSGSGIVAPDVQPEIRGVGAAYYTGTASVREVLIRKLGGIVDVEEETLRAWFETELRVMSAPSARWLGWKQSRQGQILSDGQVSDAAGRLASRLASIVSPGIVPAILAAVAGFDPWLVLEPPSKPSPEGWVELCRAERRHFDEHSEYLLRAIGVVDRETLSSLEDDCRESFAEYAWHQIVPVAPKEYGWVAERWAEVRPPRMARKDVTSLAMLNRIFIQLPRAQFVLVPAFSQAIFRSLRFDMLDTPTWVHQELGQVVVSAHDERPVGTGAHEFPNVDWWTGWYASPEWMESITGENDSLVRIRFWRKEEAAKRSNDSSGVVSYGFEEF